jgi:hypothetical protein
MEIEPLPNYSPIIHCLGDLDQEQSFSEHSQAQTHSYLCIRVQPVSVEPIFSEGKVGESLPNIIYSCHLDNE